MASPPPWGGVDPAPSPREGPVAFVMLRPGAGTGATELIAHRKQSLAWFEVPREVYLESSLPENSVGKIVKAPLRERAGASRSPRLKALAP
jgi:acyl-coenzyme A synthetase/AMP-(fatty) acid ligase